MIPGVFSRSASLRFSTLSALMLLAVLVAAGALGIALRDIDDFE